MKRIQLFIVGTFVAVGSLVAQSADADWHTGVAKVKELIQNNPTRATEEAELLLKGKKNPELIVAIAHIYLEAGKVSEAETYLALAKKVDNKIALCGDKFLKLFYSSSSSSSRA